MTTTMTNSQFGLEDMEDLLWGSTSPTADAMTSIFAPSDKKGRQNGGGGGGGGSSMEGGTSPVSSFASSSPSSPVSPHQFYSPPTPPLGLFEGDKTENGPDLLSLPWLGPDQLRDGQMCTGDKMDAFGDLDWMAERMDLSEFDLESLMGACDPTEESKSSPEDLLASLDCPMELDSFQLPPLPTPTSDLAAPPAFDPDSVVEEDELETDIETPESPCSPLYVPDVQEELEIKSEPASPAADSPGASDYTLDLGSEVDVSESEVKPVVAPLAPELPRIVLSLPSTRIILVLAPKTQAAGSATPEVIRCSPLERSSRGKPYPDPKHPPSSPSLLNLGLDESRPSRVEATTQRSALKSPKDKKLKKMVQNKTAATRYRQKKRAEQDALAIEHAALERKNLELTEKAESVGREIQYLKELLEEVRQTRLSKGLSADI